MLHLNNLFQMYEYKNDNKVDLFSMLFLLFANVLNLIFYLKVLDVVVEISIISYKYQMFVQNMVAIVYVRIEGDL
jgi:Na+/pantothenate symporter